MFENWEQSTAKSHTVRLQDYENQSLTDSLHSHATYELTFVARGTGEWQCGSEIGDFRSGSLVLIPPRVLHAWRSEAVGVSGATLWFSEACLPAALLRIPEMRRVENLLSMADSGLVFRVPDRDRLSARLRSVSRASGALRLARLYAALEMVAGFERTQLSDGKKLRVERESRMLARFATAKRFMAERFRGKLTRREVAEQVGMEEAAFSRFFHAASGVTFADYLGNLRVRHAARLLGSRRDLSIERVSRESGFGNLSAFHRQFKRRIGTTPDVYRRAANSEPLEP